MIEYAPRNRDWGSSPVWAVFCLFFFSGCHGAGGYKSSLEEDSAALFCSCERVARAVALLSSAPANARGPKAPDAVLLKEWEPRERVARAAGFGGAAPN